MKLIETIDLSTFNYSGVFQKISALVSNPFSDFINNTNAKALDDIYYIEHSGDKEISYSYSRYLQLEEDEIIPSAIDKIVDGLVVRFNSKWNKEYQALVSSTYNPLHNYDMEEETHRNIDVENTSYNNVFGYNTSSDNGVPSEKGGTTTEGDAETNYETHERSGNIGVTTTQRLIEEELELRKHNFYDMIMNDIDLSLCNAIYCIDR